MKSLRIKKILKLLIESTYLGSIFLVPLYFSFFLKTSNVFELNKIVLFRILVIFQFLFCFIYFFIQKEIKQRFIVFFNLKLKYLLIPFLYLIGLLILTIFSSLRENSFWGNYGYQLGFYSYLYFFIFYFLLISWIDNKEQINRILVTIALSSFISCIYGLVQAFGMDVFSWSESSYGRIFSTLGQPNYFASYLLLTMPILIYLLNNTRKIYLKFFYFLVLFIQVICLILTYSRGAQLAFFLGLFLSFVLFLFLNKKRGYFFLFKNKRNIILISLFLCFLFSLAWINIPEEKKARIEDLANLNKGSVASRLEYYKASWLGFREKPFFGYGLENQKEVLAFYYDKNWAIHNNVNGVPRQAHNIILDVLLTGGLFGFLLFLLLNFYFVRSIILNIKANKNPQLSFLIFFAWLCYSISLLFGFAIVVTEIYFWLFLVILSAINFLDLDNNTPEDFLFSLKNKMLYPKIFIIVIVILGVMFQANREIKIIIADHYFYKLESAIVNKKYFEAYLLRDWMKELRVRMYYYDTKIGNLLAENINNDQEEVWSEEAKKNIFPEIIKEIDDSSYESFCVRAKMYSAMASEKELFYFESARKEFENCILRTKNIPENHREYAKYYSKKKDYDNAFRELEIAQANLPDLNSAQLNNDHRKKIEREMYLINLLYGNIFLERKEYSMAEEYFLLAKSYGRDNLMIYKKIADTYYLRGDYENAISVIEEVFAEDATNYYWPYLISVIFKEQGQKERAIEFIQKAYGIDPKNTTVKEAMTELGL